MVLEKYSGWWDVVENLWIHHHSKVLWAADHADQQAQAKDLEEEIELINQTDHLVDLDF